MKIYKLHITLFFGLCISQSIAQQDAIFSQYMFNQLVFNPAHAGSSDKVAAAILYRNQWNGMQSSPKLQSFSIHSPFNQRRNGIGFQAINSSTAFQNYTEATVSYAYKIIFAKGLLSMGINGGISQASINLENRLVKDEDDATIQNYEKRPVLNPEIGAGLYYQRENFYVGFSGQHLIPSKVKYATYSLLIKQLHFYFNAGYKLKLSQSVQYIISGLYKSTAGFDPQADISQHFIVKNTAWGGISYRTTQAIALQTGVRIDKIFTQIGQEIKIGYAFDWNFNIPRPSHEIMLIIDFEIHKSPEKILRQKIQLSPFFL